MKIVCAWCERDGKAGYLGDREPLESFATTHGICPAHREQVLEDLPARSYPEVEMVVGKHLVRRLLKAALSAFIIVLGFIVCACARPPEKQWSKYGSAQEILAQDLDHCVHEAKTPYSNAKIDPHTGVSSSSGVLVDVAVFDNCMEAKGWRLVEKQTE